MIKVFIALCDKKNHVYGRGRTFFITALFGGCWFVVKFQFIKHYEGSMERHWVKVEWGL